MKILLYFDVFSPKTGKYGSEITPYLDTFQAVTHTAKFPKKLSFLPSKDILLINFALCFGLLLLFLMLFLLLFLLLF